MNPAVPKSGACDSWWSWLGLKCYGTDEEDDVEMMAAAGQTTPAMPVPYSDFPDLRTHITFDSVKHKIEVGVAFFFFFFFFFFWGGGGGEDFCLFR